MVAPTHQDCLSSGWQIDAQTALWHGMFPVASPLALLVGGLIPKDTPGAVANVWPAPLAGVSLARSQMLSMDVRGSSQGISKTAKQNLKAATKKCKPEGRNLHSRICVAIVDTGCSVAWSNVQLLLICFCSP
jgi:hypothetical protein